MRNCVAPRRLNNARPELCSLQIPGRELQLGGDQHHPIVNGPTPEPNVGYVFPQRTGRSSTRYASSLVPAPMKTVRVAGTTAIPGSKPPDRARSAASRPARATHSVDRLPRRRSHCRPADRRIDQPGQRCPHRREGWRAVPAVPEQSTPASRRTLDPEANLMPRRESVIDAIRRRSECSARQRLCRSQTREVPVFPAASPRLHG